MAMEVSAEENPSKRSLENKTGGDNVETKIFKDSSCDQVLTKIIIETGIPFSCPNLESVCTFDIEFNCSETNNHVNDLKESLGLKDSKTIEHKLGSSESKFKVLLEKCVMTMCSGEVSMFRISACIPSVSSETNKIDKLCITIHLRSFKSVTPLWQSSSQEKYNLALFHKENGTNFFKAGKIEAAFLQYSVAVKYLICILECTDVSIREIDQEKKDKIKEYNSLKHVCYLNIAACHSKVGHHSNVISSCSKALEIEENSVKGLYRRAQAYKASGQLNEARSDLMKALKLEPKNKVVASFLQECL
ncbi:unnamed protein product [Lymnaea stagnalis]|uniref:BDBT FKBP like N-terminal domain-containing protein n=1 Tax=Lymnaea stagnalis TaxID=6523 RepID=A0AAV2H5I1_LYMST